MTGLTEDEIVVAHVVVDPALHAVIIGSRLAFDQHSVVGGPMVDALPSAPPLRGRGQRHIRHLFGGHARRELDVISDA